MFYKKKHYAHNKTGEIYKDFVKFIYNFYLNRKKNLMNVGEIVFRVHFMIKIRKILLRKIKWSLIGIDKYSVYLGRVTVQDCKAIKFNSIARGFE